MKMMTLCAAKDTPGWRRHSPQTHKETHYECPTKSSRTKSVFFSYESVNGTNLMENQANDLNKHFTKG